MINNDYVTVYIPTYNRIHLLERAVNSVLNQTHKNIEVIIVDDNSTDGTHDYLKNIVRIDPRVKFFLKKKNSGACVSRNIAIKNAKGTFITGLDDDDFFEENRISTFLEKWPNKSKDIIALCSLYTIKNDKQYIKPRKKLRKKIIKFNDMFLSNKVGNQIFIETEVLRNLGGFNEQLKCWQDFECWLKVLEKGNILNIMKSTYTIDTSHDTPRIGNSNHLRYIESYNKIIGMFDFSQCQKEYLYLQTFNCEEVVLSKRDLLLTLIKYPSHSLFILFILNFIRGFR